MATDDDNGVIIDSLDYLMEPLQSGGVIPVISNSFRLEEIFREDEELFALLEQVPEFYDEFRTFDQQLTKKWAESIKYPMSDDHNLARVAQYLQVESEEGAAAARKRYIKFLVERLLKLNENDEKFKDKVAGFRKNPNPLFSKVANDLEYPRFVEGFEDPLRLLAKLPVKIYITTSYSNFLELALEAEDKKPRTQLCFCKFGKANIKDEFKPDPKFDPREAEPAVVHLFGMEEYPSTLVLSEDDHINFLLNAVEALDPNSPEYPSYLRGALSESSLLLLGYHLRDWDFRTLYRFLSKIRKTDSMDNEVAPSMAIQFKPSLGIKDNEDRSIKYLQKYFKKRNFRVKWDSTESFVYDLWGTWIRYGEAQL
jgi:hypothetical protein